MITSLRSRLLIILGTSALVVWLAIAVFSYVDTKRLIDDMLDISLQQSAELIVALLDGAEAQTQKNIALQLTDHSELSPHIGCRIWTSGGDLLISSTSVPDTLPDIGGTGFRNITHQATFWRSYRINTADGIIVEVAQKREHGSVFAQSVAGHVLHTVWFAIPLLTLLIWSSIRWGLASLQEVADLVKQRSAIDLNPLDLTRAPDEIQPLVLALNGLFARVSGMIDNERRFTSDAAHELRTPLAAIKTHAQIAQNASNKNEADDAIENLCRGADRAQRLVEQLLVLARLDHQDIALDIVPFDLQAELILEIREQTPVAIAKHIDFGLSGEVGDSYWLAGNSNLVRILLRNLIDNALRYAPEYGKVTAGITRNGTKLRLDVTNTVSNFSEASSKRMFDRFYRVEGTDEDGCGLGLSIVTRIAEIHGALVSIENDPDELKVEVSVVFST